eukprot:CAMPEP_0185759716 /NCGR_PEP_ID=MMETSP1174-20130828/18492_1 /TAXON_ID=35687 /ORGANISM="Dictyocha speculum, Strain CCMP1381" /LENGTH=150 /DNA_ID=CAMNT_0028440189 /DNA_START=82 /DNA_END=534 /DNA_ORIENTATION=-
MAKFNLGKFVNKVVNKIDEVELVEDVIDDISSFSLSPGFTAFCILACTITVMSISASKLAVAAVADGKHGELTEANKEFFTRWVTIAVFSIWIPASIFGSSTSLPPSMTAAGVVGVSAVITALSCVKFFVLKKDDDLIGSLDLMMFPILC